MPTTWLPPASGCRLLRATAWPGETPCGLEIRPPGFPKTPHQVGGTGPEEGAHSPCGGRRAGGTRTRQPESPGPGPRRPHSGGIAARRCPPRSPAARTCRGCGGPGWGSLREEGKAVPQPHPGGCPQGEGGLTSLLLISEAIPMPRDIHARPRSRTDARHPREGLCGKRSLGAGTPTMRWGRLVTSSQEELKAC